MGGVSIEATNSLKAKLLAGDLRTAQCRRRGFRCLDKGLGAKTTVRGPFWDNGQIPPCCKTCTARPARLLPKRLVQELWHPGGGGRAHQREVRAAHRVHGQALEGGRQETGTTALRGLTFVLINGSIYVNVQRCQGRVAWHQPNSCLIFADEASSRGASDRASQRFPAIWL